MTNQMIGTSLLLVALIGACAFGFVMHELYKRSQEENAATTKQLHNVAYYFGRLAEQMLHIQPNGFIRLKTTQSNEVITLTSQKPFECIAFRIGEAEGDILYSQTDGVATLLGAQYVLKLTLPECGDYQLWFGLDANSIQVRPPSTIITRPSRAVPSNDAPSTTVAHVHQVA